MSGTHIDAVAATAVSSGVTLHGAAIPSLAASTAASNDPTITWQHHPDPVYGFPVAINYHHLRGSSSSSNNISRNGREQLVAAAFPGAGINTVASHEGGALGDGFGMGNTKAPESSHNIFHRIFEKLQLLERTGTLGYALLLVCFSIWVCFALPVTPVEIALGFIYGGNWGFITSLFCKVFGSCLAFGLARKIGRWRSWTVPQMLRPQFAKLQTRPLLAIVTVRLMPVPLGVKNYGLGLCEVKLFDFFLGTLAVDVPFSFIWSMAGASCRSLSEALDFTVVSSIVTLTKITMAQFAPIVSCILLVVVIATFGLRRKSESAAAAKASFAA